MLAEATADLNPGVASIARVYERVVEPVIQAQWR